MGLICFLQSNTALYATITISFFIALFFLFINRKWIKPRKNNLPPGPKPLPVIGNLHQIGLLPHRSLQPLSQEHGPLMYLKLGSIPTIIITSSEVAREVFKNHDRLFSGRPISYAGKKLSYGCSNVTFAPYGDYWREMRKIVILELLSQKRVQLFEKVRSEEVQSMVDSITRHSSCPINVSETVISVANKVICRVAFGTLYENSKVHELLGDLQELLAEFNVADFIPWMWWINKINGTDKRIAKCMKECDDLFERVIQEHQVDDPKRLDVSYHEDLVDVLLRVKNDPTQSIALNNNQIKAILVEIFEAGSDPSSATIIWAMAELIRNPTVMKRAQEEVREVVKEKGKVEESDLSQLVYLRAVIKETLRIRPSVPLLAARETLDDCTIFGYDIPAKTKVIIHAKLISTDPKCWERENEFWPERFLDSQIDFRGHHFELLPFGAGRRGCPGLNFGVMVIELVLANLLNKFDWKLPDGMNIDDLDMEEKVGLTMYKKTPLCLVAIPAK